VRRSASANRLLLEFPLAAGAKVEDFDGDPDSVGMNIAQKIAEELNDEDFHAVAVPKGTEPPPSDLRVTGEVTNIDGGNTAARVLVGWGAGDAVVGAQGHVTRADGGVIGIFSEEKLGAGKWIPGQEAAVRSAAERVGEEIALSASYLGGLPEP
jgi:hypothetical protein